jgi:hypothetical protein
MQRGFREVAAPIEGRSFTFIIAQAVGPAAPKRDTTEGRPYRRRGRPSEFWLLELEAPPGFEPGNGGFAIVQATPKH